LPEIGDDNEARKLLEDVLEIIDDLLKKLKNDECATLIDYFKVYGSDNARKIAQLSLMVHKGLANYRLGRVLLELDNLDKSIEYFKIWLYGYE
jgi:tetratricopeptide (TPR) repeat protein